jgi:aspartyl-tRNA(Asn)/glutamyl-tRNA(Gln) amidotransferase subunit A
VEDLNLHTEKYFSSWIHIRLAGPAKVHLKWLNIRADDYSPKVNEMLLNGEGISSADYSQYLRETSYTFEIRNEILSIFSVTPLTYISIGKNVVMGLHKVLLQNTLVFNSTGLPAISVPIGLTKENLPVGVQIIGPSFSEEIILSVAKTVEKFWKDRPTHLFDLLTLRRVETAEEDY